MPRGRRWRPRGSSRPPGRAGHPPRIGRAAPSLGRARGSDARPRALEHRRERLVGRIVAGDHEQPARPRVEPVDDPRTERAAAAAQRDPHAEQAVHHRAAPSVLGRVRRQPGRLANDDQVLVPPGDLERRSLARELGRRSEIDLDPFAARQPVRLLQRGAVHEHRPRGDRALNLRPRDPEARRHHRVESAGLGLERLAHGFGAGAGRGRPRGFGRLGWFVGPVEARDREQDRRTDDDGGVREVEHRPDLQVDEVRDRAR